MEGLEVISKDISRYAVIESLYLHMPSSVGKLLEDSILATYGSILYFLSRCRKHFDRTFSQRLGKSVTQTPEVFVKKHLDRIDKNDREVLKLISLADGERIKSSLSQQSVIDSKIDDLDDDFQNLQLKTSESASKLRNLLASFEDPILRTMETVTAISDMLIETKTQSESKQERLEILQWLSSVQYKKHHQGLAKSLLKGTGSWLLKKPQFIEWSASSVSSVLWLHGIRKLSPLCRIFKADSRKPARERHASCECQDQCYLLPTHQATGQSSFRSFSRTLKEFQTLLQLRISIVRGTQRSLSDQNP